MRVRGFIIHLAHAEKRRPQVEQLLKTFPFPTTVVDAVSGYALTDAEITAAYRRHKHKPHYPFELRRAEIGCFLSHRKVWEEIISCDLDAGLIVEDDLEIDDSLFHKILEFSISNIKQGDYIRFPYRTRGDKGRSLLTKGSMTLNEPMVPGLGTLAQLVSRNAAIKLLKATEVFDRPVDTFIQLRSVQGIRILAIRPTSLKHLNKTLGTTIHTKSNSLEEVLSRELKRAKYRFLVRKMAWMRR